MLYGLGWIPLSYKKWISPDKQEWISQSAPNTPFPIMTVIKEIIRAYHIYIYMADKARKHYHGDSIGKIVAREAVLSRNKSLKHKKKFLELAILETIQVGAAWPVTRVEKSIPGARLGMPTLRAKCI